MSDRKYGAMHRDCYVAETGRQPKGNRTANTDRLVCVKCKKAIARGEAFGWTRDNTNGARHGTPRKDAPIDVPFAPSPVPSPAYTFQDEVQPMIETPAPSKPMPSAPLSPIAAAILTEIEPHVRAHVDPSRIERIARTAIDSERESLLAAVQDLLAKHVPANGARRVEIVSPKLPEPKDMGVQHRQFDDLLALLGPGDHVWIAGEAGTGKTHAAEQVAKALGLDYAYTGSVADKYEFSGYRDAHGVYHGTALRKVWEHGGVWVHDEADRSDNGALLALNACLSNGTASFPDGMVKRHPNCRIIVTANTIGQGPDAKYVGAARIDAAFRNRFFLLRWELDTDLELATTPWDAWTREVQAVRDAIKSRGLKVMVTPRESYRGPRALARGARLEVVRRSTWGADMTDDQFVQVSNQIHTKVTDSMVAKWRAALPKETQEAQGDAQ